MLAVTTEQPWAEAAGMRAAPGEAACSSRAGAVYAAGGKRLLDVVVGAVLVVLLLPVLLLTAGGVLLCMGLPIVYADRRAGPHGRPFTVLKFRSMREAIAGDGNPLPDAVRLPRFGRFLRRTSLDELPQLFCVLGGSMSLVGPRPLPEQYVPRYSPRQATRLLVRPGLTGWAQIHGRNAVGWNERLALDADCVAMLGRSGGFLLDLRILAATAGLVFRQAVTGQGVNAPGHATMPEFLGDGGM